MRWSLLYCLLLILAVPFPVHADCDSAIATADKTAARAQSSLKKKDWKAASNYYQQATRQYTTASHSCSGEQKGKAKEEAAVCQKLADGLKDVKLLQEYGEAVKQFNNHHSQGSKLVQQEKWKEAANKFDKAASALQKFTKSKNQKIQASAKAQVEAAKAAAVRARAKANG